MTTPQAGAVLATAEAEEVRLLASRERERVAKAERRARLASERAVTALEPNASGYVVVPMPAGLRAQRRWAREVQDAYHRRQIGVVELTECRRAVTVQAESYKAGAVVRQSFAAMRAAAAQERMTELLATVEHGGTAMLLLDRLTAAMDRPLRRLPPRITPAGANGGDSG
jgi:hypothetical protein